MFFPGPRDCADLATGDLDRDGNLDLVLVSANYNDVAVLRGLDDGTFAPLAALKASGAGMASVTLADLDGNGWLDIAVAAASSSSVDIFYTVPEPGTACLLALGAVALRRRRRR